MEKLKMHSPNLTSDNIAKLAELFPSCVTEKADEDGTLKQSIDFDLLRQELSGSVVEGPQERFHQDWPGKRQAMLTANAPIAKTLRASRVESVDFETTQNLFIEGDNLEALKLLQETYLGKIKLIYIDPPYNTGNDFIYQDNFAEKSESFLKRSNQKDEKGNHLISNSSSNGRFHSDWLTMIYSRVRLAWNLLSDDGIIGISINDAELFQIGKVMDEIFGSNSRLACAPWLSEASGGKEKTGLRTGHEYLIIYYKRTSINITQEERSSGNLNLKDTVGPYRKGRELMKWGGTSLRKDRPNQFYPLLTPTDEEVHPYRNDGKEGHWRWGKQNPDILKAQADPNFFHWEQRPFDDDVLVDNQIERWVPYEKIRDPKKSVGWSTWLDKYGTNADGTRELKELFGVKIFDTPKPTQLIKWFLSLHSDENSIVLDFFAGSCATADAVIQLNAEDFGRRKFIVIQMPELTDESSEAFKAGYKTIADIGKERIRKAGKKIALDENSKSTKNEELFNTTKPQQKSDLDIGFRVFHIDTSNMSDIYYNPDLINQEKIDLFAENIKSDRSEEDLLFQVLLDWGVDLSLPIVTKTVNKLEVFQVDTDALVACFAKKGEITEAFCKELAKNRPLRVVFRDAGFKSDAVKINVEQIFKQLSPATEVRTI
jgi:adenine-specific DNA-methyltransferase